MSIGDFATESFCRQMCDYGFFTEQIPPCYSSKAFAKKYSKLNSLVTKPFQTAPVTLSIYKTKTSRRVVSAANPYAFACVAQYLGEHRKEVLRYARSENSESPVTFIHYYNEDKHEVINSELARTVLKAKCDFRKNLRDRINKAMGYRFRLSVDIATFYDSIYTHSIAWAVCGKREAKRIRFQEGAKKTEQYVFADNLDTRMRNQKNQETSGILTGPFTSRIFSEIIMAAVDKILREEGYIFKRYVDDFKFYFRSEPEAQKAIVEISKIIAEFNLSINQAKIEIVEYPFDLESRMKERLDNSLEDSVYSALMEAGRLYLEGEKGAYKYALKMLKNKAIPDVGFESVLSMLFNINLLDPKYARFIVDYLRKSKSVVGGQRLSEIINAELRCGLQDGHEQEVLNLLFFLRAIGLELEGSLLLDSLKMGNDFIDVIALDCWVNKNDLVKRSLNEARAINQEVNRISDALQKESVDGEHWLLIYEAKAHKLLNAGDFTGKAAVFFEKMLDQGVSFYCPDRG